MNVVKHGEEQYWYIKIIRWDTIYKSLDTSFQRIGHSSSNFWPFTLQEKGRNKPMKSSHGFMEACFRENFPTIEECYVGSLHTKPRDVFSLEKYIMKGQLFIVQSLDEECAIRLGSEK